MKTSKWNIYEELKTEEDIQAFVEASIVEAENDTDPSLLAHALGVAAKARGMLAQYFLFILIPNQIYNLVGFWIQATINYY